jgi:hypothetical protein
MSGGHDYGQSTVAAGLTTGVAVSAAALERKDLGAQRPSTSHGKVWVCTADARSAHPKAMQTKKMLGHGFSIQTGRAVSGEPGGSGMSWNSHLV